MQEHFLSLFQLLLFCNGPGAHSWEESAALITLNGDTPTHYNGQEREKTRAATKAVSPLELVSESKDKTTAAVTEKCFTFYHDLQTVLPM